MTLSYLTLFYPANQTKSCHPIHHVRRTSSFSLFMQIYVRLKPGGQIKYLVTNVHVCGQFLRRESVFSIVVHYHPSLIVNVSVTKKKHDLSKG